ncbi:hypothetical protein N7460_008891 [Penicillium canescens]|uniref:H/ACA ribonucleoprotein complex subunit NOP10 n=1 Tax=Penicillium canescens TaxID=5083 RepID=A0AAD6N5Y6_PENCN|nr:hypothetical protein N7460_008891 [Penicillium canescens]
MTQQGGPSSLRFIEKKFLHYRRQAETKHQYRQNASYESVANFNEQYTLDTEGKRVYTLKKVLNGEVTKSAHPARFSPDDKYSRHRVTLKKRYGLLLTQQSAANPAQP